MNAFKFTFSQISWGSGGKPPAFPPPPPPPQVPRGLVRVVGGAACGSSGQG